MKIANQMMKGFSLLALVACLSISASAQKAYVLPSPTDANAELTLYIDMNQSEDGLQNNGLSAFWTPFLTPRSSFGLGIQQDLRLGTVIGTIQRIIRN